MNKKPLSLIILVAILLFTFAVWTVTQPPTFAARQTETAVSPTNASSPPPGILGDHQIYLPLITHPCPLPLRNDSGWLDYVNFYRGTAGLFPVTENTAWSCGNVLHGRYMVKNDLQEHDEDPANPWYTAQGQVAAMSSNLASSTDVNETDSFAIEAFMQAPFHAVGILDPRLYTVGFGSYREADGGLQMGAGLDVIQGLGPITDTITYPIAWPTQGSSIPLTLHWGEYPSPLTSCPGYTTPSGLPIILQLGPGDVVPDVTATSFMENGLGLDHCVFDETNYNNPDATAQDLGCLILNYRDAVILVPKDPIIPGATYTVSITANGTTHTWSFEVSAEALTAVPSNLYISQVASP